MHQQIDAGNISNVLCYKKVPSLTKWEKEIYLVISHQKHYFVEYQSDSTHKYSEVENKKMLEFPIDNIFVVVGSKDFQQSVGISMGINCAPLLEDLFLYSYEAEFIRKLLHKMKKKSLSVAFSSTFRYIDDVLSINSNQHICRFDIQMYPNELEIKDNTECSTSLSYLDTLFKLDTDGKLSTQLYEKQGDFNFSMVNFPYLCRNIPV
jgi:hypothetical protein